jgi:hypothetical protein
LVDSFNPQLNRVQSKEKINQNSICENPRDQREIKKSPADFADLR